MTEFLAGLVTGLLALLCVARLATRRGRSQPPVVAPGSIAAHYEAVQHRRSRGAS